MTSSQGFQATVNTVQSPAVEGDFSDTNPRFTVDAGPGGLVAGAAGLTIARFGWLAGPNDPDGTRTQVDNFGSGKPDGFIHREQQGLNTTYLSEASMFLPQGFPVTLFSGGGFWVKNNGTATAYPGNKCYANTGNGGASFAASGSPGTATVTGSIGPMPTTSFTGSIANDIMTVTVVASGFIPVGATIAGTGGGGVASGTKVVSQLSGTRGGVGTYAVSIGEQTVTSAAGMTAAAGLLNVTSVASGTLSVGDILANGSITSGTVISDLGTGTGTTGTYYVDPTQTASSASITANVTIETNFVARSTGAAGELVKISNQPVP